MAQVEASRSYLRFFDKSGYSLNGSYDFNADAWYAKMHFPKVSAGLNENQHIFVVQEFTEVVPTPPDGYVDLGYVDGGFTSTGVPLLDTGKKIYGFPFTNHGTRKFRARFLDGGDEEIFLYDVNNDEGFPTIIKTDAITYGENIPSMIASEGALTPIILDDEYLILDGEKVITYVSASSDGLVGGDGTFGETQAQKFISEFISGTLQINIGVNGQEGIYERTLVIEEIISEGNSLINTDSQVGIKPLDGSITHIFALIDFYAEIEGEDLRFRNMLENFGKRINPENAYIFRDADIEEDLPDFKLLNEKRKELLLEGDNIYPYLGSYKALLNAIDFFGYGDLRLKEYWLNIDESSPNYKTYKQITIKNGNGEIEFSNSMLPSTNYKKTALFGLFYNINEVTGEFDQFGIPEVKDSFMFTQDEVIFKLFGLRDLLKKEFLPLNARILDICGEGIYFERYRLTQWSNSLQIINQELNITPDFEIQTDGYIDDLRHLFYNEDGIYPHLSGFDPIKIEEVLRVLMGYFSDGQKPIQFGDDPTKMIAGCPIVLTNLTFENKWDDMDDSWDSYLYFTWDQMEAGNFYEAEWIVEKIEGVNKYYVSSDRKPISEIKNWATILPYTGFYSVTLKMFDTQNNVSKRVKRNAFEVFSHEIEISALYRSSEFAPTWDLANDVTWDDMTSPWKDAKITEKTTWDDMQISWDSLSWFRFRDQEFELNQGKYDLNKAARKTGSEFIWDGMKDFKWDDLANTSWDMLDMHGDTYCGFMIIDFAVGGSIRIKGLVDEFEMLGSYGNTWEGLVQELRECALPGFNDFYYTLIDLANYLDGGDFNNDYSEDFKIYGVASILDGTVKFIQATAKYHGAHAIYALEYRNGMKSEFTNYLYGNSYPLVNSLAWSVNPELDLINRPPLWNWLYRNYSEWRGKYELNNIQIPLEMYTEGHVENQQNPLHSAISCYFNWDDLVMRNNYFNAKVGVPFFLICDRSKIPGKRNIRWKLFNEKDELLVDTKHEFLLWTPSEEGRILVEVELEDYNSNKVKKRINSL